MYKYSHGNLPDVIQNLFQANNKIHGHNMRQRLNLRQPVASREYMYTNFSFHDVYVWNYIISKTTININSSYNSFKYSLKKSFVWQ